MDQSAKIATIFAQTNSDRGQENEAERQSYISRKTSIPGHISVDIRKVRECHLII